MIGALILIWVMCIFFSLANTNSKLDKIIELLKEHNNESR